MTGRKGDGDVAKGALMAGGKIITGDVRPGGDAR